MNQQEIDKIIKERKVEGKSTANKVISILKEFGIATQRKYGHNFNHTIEDINGTLKMSYDDYGNNLHVVWYTAIKDESGKIILDEENKPTFNVASVLDMHLGEITTYRPDIPDWISVMDDEYLFANEKDLERKNQEEIKKKEMLFKNWGIS